MLGIDARVAMLAEAQAGVVSLDQLREAGISPRAAAHRAQRGSLHRVHRAVYAVGHPAIGEVGALRAALLAGAEGAVVSHGTAAATWGLRDRRPTLVDLIVPNQRGRKVDGVRCRRCRYPSSSEISDEPGFPCTTPARTLVDLAGMLGTASLAKAVERAAVRKLLDHGEIDAALAGARRRPGIRALRGILDAWWPADGPAPDVRSEFEALVLSRLVAMGLPRPACNETLHLGEARLVVDFLWPAQRLVVETDGRETHETPIAYQRDRWRDQVLLAAGYRIARVTWAQIQEELDAVIARIGNALNETR